MRHLRLSSFIATILVLGLLGEQMALAQGSRAWSGVAAAASGARSAPAAGTAAGSARTAPTGNVGFAQRVGSTVALPASPAMAFPPGVGNINRPGVAPAVMPGFQPLPTNIQGIPNINFPAGIPASRGFTGGPRPDGRPDGRGDGRFDGRRGVHSGRVGGTIVYGVPYAVPYYVPYAQYPEDSNVEVAPDGSTTSVYGGSYIAPQVEPGVTSFPEGGQGQMQGSVESSPQATQPGGSPLSTLLVLKDHTLLLVTNYWLDGDSLTYDTGNGEEASILVSQLDFSLTQQLNRERNVPFILQSRP